MKKDRGGNGKKPKQHNIARFQRAMEGLVTGEGGGNSGASEATDQGRYKRKLSRKDERKKSRATKKARNNKHHSKKLPKNVQIPISMSDGSTAPFTGKAGKRKGKGKVSQSDEEDADVGAAAAAAKEDGKQKKKGKKKKKVKFSASAGSAKPEVSSEDASGPNAKFFALLQADGLVNVEGDEGNAAALEPVDEDEAEMKKMEKLLNMKGGKLSKEFEDDGLGGLLDFTNPDMDDEDDMQWADSDSDADASNHEDEDADRDDDVVDDDDDEEEEEEEDSDIDEYAAIKIRAAAAAIAADYSDEEVVEHTDDEELDSDDAFDGNNEERDEEEDEEDDEDDEEAAVEEELNDDQDQLQAFQKAKRFGGSRLGFVFKMGDLGLGYYADVPHATSSSSSSALQKGKPEKEKKKGKEEKKEKKKKKSKKVETKASLGDDGQNSGFFEMLRENGLVGDDGEAAEGDDAMPDFNDNEDDAVIERMERLLQIKKGKIGKEFEEDGLDLLLGFEDEAKEAQEKWVAGGMQGLPGFDSSDDDAAPEEISSSTQKKKKKPLTAADFTIDPAAAGDDASDFDDVDSEDDLAGDRLLQDDSDSENEGGDGDGDDDDEEGASDADKDSADEDAAPVEPATYITRAEAFGDNVPGGGARPDAPPVQRWVPPSQRKQSDESVRVQRHVKGQLNRLNEANMVAIIKVIEGVFETRSRNEVSTVLTTFIMDACMNKSSTLQHLLTVYAAGISAFHHVVGMEVSAHFLQELAERFQTNYDRVISEMDKSGNEDTLDKQCTNLALMLCYLFNFRVVHSSVIIDFFDRLIEKFTPLDVEVLMSCLNTSASRLRGDDNISLNRILDTVKEKGASTEQQSTRMKWMIETIGETKGKGALKYGKDAGETFTRLNKAVRSYVNQRKVAFKDPLRVPWVDLLEAKTRGRWWLVGSAWAGRDGATGQPALPQNADGGSGAGNADGLANAAENTELLSIAATQRMNTDIRRKIFVAMMGAEDYLDAFEKLLRLRLKDKQDREVVRILIDNCVQEKTYNPFYAHLGAKLCQHNHNHKFTFQYAFWDRFQLLEEMNVAQVSHLAKLLAHLIIQHALSMSVLKTVQFNSLGSKGVLTFQLFFVYLLTNYKESPTSKAFERLAMHEGQAALKDSFLVFMRHYVRKFTLGIGNGGNKSCVTPSQKHDLLYDRLKLAKRFLTRTTMTKRGTR